MTLDPASRLVAAGPTPLAQLAQRARNSKTGAAVLQNAAHYLGEAGAALAASFWLARVRAAGKAADATVLRALAPILARGPSFGTWVGLLRASVAAADPAASARLLGPLDHASPVETLVAALEREISEEESFGSHADALRSAMGSARTGGVLGFLDFLVAFRNRAFGHGSMLPERTCRRLARPFLDAVSHVLAEPALFDAHVLGRTGVAVLEAEGAWHWTRFVGTTPEFLPPGAAGFPPAAGVDPSTLHFVSPSGSLVPLAPLVVHQEDATGLSSFGFFMRIVGGKAPSVEYLDYIAKPFRHDAALPAARALVAALGERAGAEERESTEPSDGPRRFGDFLIEDVLGRGASGVVHRARQVSLGRTVALKILAPTFVQDPIALGRFRREVQALSSCDHPDVVRILAHGVEEGRPWYAMEYVEGHDLADVFATLARWKGKTPALSAAHLLAASSSRGGSGDEPRAERSAEGVRLPAADPPESLRGDEASGSLHVALARIFAGAAEGLSAIHAAGIVHRDVKPANLMLTADGSRLVVMDLGLAKTADESVSLTREGNKDFVGSARYAAPEQLQSRLVGVDARADVYGLGATLYEMTTLARFYDTESLEELLRDKLREDPPPPRALDPGMPEDLDTIVRKATARLPEERYESAEALAADLRRFAEDRPIAARPPSRLYYLRLFYRRNRGLVRALAVAGMMLAGVVAAAFLLVTQQARRAERALLVASEQREVAEASLRRARAMGLVSASQEATAEHPLRALLLARAAVDAEETQGSVDALRAALFSPTERAILGGHAGAVLGAAFSPDGTRVVTAPLDGTPRIFDVSGRELVALKGHADAVVAAAFSPDGARVATASRDGTVRLWDASGGEVAVLPHGEVVTSATFSPDGRSLLTTCVDGAARTWDTSGRRLALMQAEASLGSGAFSPDGERVATADYYGGVRLWRASGEPIAAARGHEAWVHSVAFARDGALVTASDDRTARLWDGAGRALAVLRHDGEVWSAAFSPDGATIVTTSFDATARTWDRDGRELAVLRGHQAQVYAARFTPDGRHLVTASADRSARRWNGAGSEILAFHGHLEQVYGLDLSPDGRLAVTASGDGTARVWSVAPHAEDLRLAHDDAVLSAAWSPDGARVVTGCRDGTAWLWDVRDGSASVLRAHAGVIGCVAFSPAGTHVATASRDGSARLFDARGAALAILSGHVGPVRFVSFSPDGARLVTAGDDGTIRTWDLEGREIGSIQLEGHLACARFSPDGTRILVASESGGKALSLALDGTVLASFVGHEGEVVSVAMSPDGTRVATASRDHSARLWDASGAPLAVLRGHESEAWCVAFSPDGKSLVTAGADRTVRLWDGEGRATAILRGHRGVVHGAVFSRDGRLVLSSGSDAIARAWPVSTAGVLDLASKRAVRELDAAERERYGELLAAPSAGR